MEIRDNLTGRIAEAEREGWMGEAEGLRVSLAARRRQAAGGLGNRRRRPGGPVTVAATSCRRVALPRLRKDRTLRPSPRGRSVRLATRRVVRHLNGSRPQTPRPVTVNASPGRASGARLPAGCPNRGGSTAARGGRCVLRVRQPIRCSCTSGTAVRARARWRGRGRCRGAGGSCMRRTGLPGSHTASTRSTSAAGDRRARATARAAWAAA